MSKGLRESAHIEFLRYVPDALKSEIVRRLRMSRATRGRTLVEKGAISSDVYFVQDGRAEVVLYSSNGREVYVNALGPGDMFGEMAAIDGEPRSASVVALSDLSFAVMRAEDFRACIQGVPEAGLWLARKLTLSIRRLTEKVFELSALNVRARIHHELLRLAGSGESRGGSVNVCPAPTHAAMAKRIGTHREAVTREMQALAELGIIEYDRRRLTFLDIEGLQREANR